MSSQPDFPRPMGVPVPRRVLRAKVVRIDRHWVTVRALDAQLPRELRLHRLRGWQCHHPKLEPGAEGLLQFEQGLWSFHAHASDPSHSPCAAGNDQSAS